MYDELQSKSILEVGQAFSKIQSHQKSRRLGVYFEQIVLTAFELFEGTELVANSIQIQKEKTTIGEIDAVIFEKSSKEYWHIEIAVKFYMSTKSSSDARFWLGPNANDNLSLKFDKLKNQQLKLTDDSYVLNQLERFNIPCIDRKYTLTRGAAFLPFIGQVSNVMPEELSSEATKGLWCYDRDVQKLTNIFSRDARWVLLSKLEWIGNVLFDDSKEMMSTSMVVKAVRKSPIKNALHFAVSQPKTQGISSIVRVFLMPDNWPK